MAGCRGARFSPAPPYDGGEYSLQGLAGVAVYEGVSLDLTGPGAIAVDDGENSLPILGAVLQLTPAGGEHLRFGLEGGGTIAWEQPGGKVQRTAGVTVNSQNELILADLFAGPYAEFRSGRWRAYAGAGPLLQIGSVDFTYTDTFNNEVAVGGDGFGNGWYSRAGVERLFGTTLVGLGVRWVDSEVDPGGGVGLLELDGVQFFLTATQ